MLLDTFLVKFSIVVVKHCDHKHLGKKGFIFLSYQITVHDWEMSGQKLKKAVTWKLKLIQMP